jgi:charged multivesicular body protein 6
MLGSRITHQDEEEVEDELAALEVEVNGPAKLPNVPKSRLSGSKVSEQPTTEEEEAQPERREAMLAA